MTCESLKLIWYKVALYEVNCEKRRRKRGSHKARVGSGCRPSPWRDCVGGLYKVRDPNEPGKVQTCQGADDSGPGR